MATKANGNHSNGVHAKNGASYNGNGKHEVSPEKLTFGKLYSNQLTAQPPMGFAWFTVPDMLIRMSSAVIFFYRVLFTQPRRFALFAYKYNSLWYGKYFGPLMLIFLPYWPVVLAILELGKRLNKTLNPFAKKDWKIAGPGRIWFVPPKSLFASLIWDSFLALQNFCGHYALCGTDDDAIMHTWYDSICTKEFWNKHLDEAGARRPLQLAHWDGVTVHKRGPGIEYGKSDLVCKLSDSYLGIGDRVLKRGVDFKTHEDVQAVLSKDEEYAGRPAVLSERMGPATTVKCSSESFSNVHSLDIVTLQDKSGVTKILSVVLWTDCTGWSSHSATCGYLVDVATETVIAPTAWYAPYFATQEKKLVGMRVPGALEACKKAIAAHEACKLPWLIAVGWDAMITDDGPIFFEGNVAAYRTPRRMFLTYSSMTTTFDEFCS
mmetsp:Transcript_1846/g.3796  ORF Transcript_1846/g.3796 Transcript_1846/m.3796 type:complete len:434 (+) Transcript_1846:38-1339(+)